MPFECVDILAKHSDTLVSLYQSGLVSRDSALAEIQSMGKLLGAFANLEAPETPAVLPEVSY